MNYVELVHSCLELESIVFSVHATQYTHTSIRLATGW